MSRAVGLGLMLVTVIAVFDTAPAQAAAPGAVEITCDVDRRTFRTLAKSETQVTFRLWDAESGGAQCGTAQIVLMKDLKVFNSKTDRFDGQKTRRFASMRAVLGSDASPIQLCTGAETWLDVTVGTTTLTCDFSADDDPKNPPPAPARKRVNGVPFAQQVSVLSTCPSDSARAGSVCVDKYEASVWSIPGANTALVNKVRRGEVTLSDLTGGGATQYGIASDDYPCADHGNDCKDQIYAVSVQGANPGRYVTWFQSQMACGNSLKRLVTNAEWQLAAAGTPDVGGDNGTTDCNVASVGVPIGAGSRSACVSVWGVFDMIGNVYEWVADWVPLSTTTSSCPGWGAFSDDVMCLAGASTTSGPGAMFRGNWAGVGPVTNAGVFAIRADAQPSYSAPEIGFRCAR